MAKFLGRMGNRDTWRERNWQEKRVRKKAFLFSDNDRVLKHNYTPCCGRSVHTAKLLFPIDLRLLNFGWTFHSNDWAINEACGLNSLLTTTVLHFNLGGQERTVRAYTELACDNQDSLSHVHIFTGLPALLSQKGSNKAGRLPAVSLSCKSLCWLLAVI